MGWYDLDWKGSFLKIWQWLATMLAQKMVALAHPLGSGQQFQTSRLMGPNIPYISWLLNLQFSDQFKLIKFSHCQEDLYAQSCMWMIVSILKIKQVAYNRKCRESLESSCWFVLSFLIGWDQFINLLFSGLLNKNSIILY